MNSTNGLFLNGRRIKSAILTSGDILMFGGPANVRIGQFVPYRGAEFLFRFEEFPEDSTEDDRDEDLDGNRISRRLNKTFFLLTLLGIPYVMKNYPQLWEQVRTLLEPWLLKLGIPASDPIMFGGFGVSAAVFFRLLHRMTSSSRKPRH